MIDTNEKLVEILRTAGVHGEWINPNMYGVSRTYRFYASDTTVFIEWQSDYFEVQIGPAKMLFTEINRCNKYASGEWIEFAYKGQEPLRLRIK